MKSTNDPECLRFISLILDRRKEDDNANSKVRNSEYFSVGEVMKPNFLSKIVCPTESNRLIYYNWK